MIDFEGEPASSLSDRRFETIPPSKTLQVWFALSIMQHTPFYSRKPMLARKTGNSCSARPMMV